MANNALLVSAAPMTEREFGMVFVKLATQLGTKDADVLTIKSYFEALQDLSLEAIRMAASAFSREPGRQWMPNAPQWREKVQELQREALREAVQPAREKGWQVECQDCDDTGWQMGLECDGGGAQWPEEAAPNTLVGKKPWSYRPQDRQTSTPRQARCDRPRTHLPHSFTRPCPCRPTNRTFQRHQNFGRGE
jgi:hypothetical protein